MIWHLHIFFFLHHRKTILVRSKKAAKIKFATREAARNAKSQSRSIFADYPDISVKYGREKTREEPESIPEPEPEPDQEPDYDFGRRPAGKRGMDQMEPGSDELFSGEGRVLKF